MKSSKALTSFIRQQDAATLASMLIELAEDHEVVRERLVRLHVSGRPKALAAAFRKTLAAWKRSTRYIDYSQAGEFSQELEEWLAQVERELMPRDPAEALALAEAFIEADEVFFNRADDSNGAIGDAMGSACLLWLRAAARCESPGEQWPDRMMSLVLADQYGAREALLRHADLLLSEAAMRGLVAACEVQLDEAIAKGPAAPKRSSRPEAHAAAALSLLSEALRDPQVLVRAVLRRSPDPNPVQKAELVKAFLTYDQPEGALQWLEGSWKHLERAREDLQAQALKALGRTGEASVVRQRIFEESLAIWDLHAWVELLPLHEQPRAVERARELAAKHDDPVVVALLMMDVGDESAAESALASAPGGVDGRDYTTLVPLAKALEEKGLWAGATVVYRALLAAILERGYSPAYQHAAKYWARLEELALNDSIQMLETPGVFRNRIRDQHKRKTSFWTHVENERTRKHGAGRSAESA
jgi:hypothetical protein